MISITYTPTSFYVDCESKSGETVLLLLRQIWWTDYKQTTILPWKKNAEMALQLHPKEISLLEGKKCAYWIFI